MKIIIIMLIINKNDEGHNKKRLFIPDHPYRMLIIGDSGSGKQMHYLI